MKMQNYKTNNSIEVNGTLTLKTTVKPATETVAVRISLRKDCELLKDFQDNQQFIAIRIFKLQDLPIKTFLSNGSLHIE